MGPTRAKARIVAGIAVLFFVAAGSSSARAAEDDHGWETRVGGTDDEEPYASAFSADGARLFVTGSVARREIPRPARNDDWTTSALDARTGKILWTSRFDAVAGNDAAYTVAGSPDGELVYVGGETGKRVGHPTVVAYDASDGSQRWIAKLNDSRPEVQGLIDTVVVTPDGSKVIAVGNLDATEYSYPGWWPQLNGLVVVLDAATGEVLTERTFDGAGSGLDHATHVTLSPDGRVAAVSLQSIGVSNTMDPVTLLFDLQTNELRLIDDGADPVRSDDVPLSILFSPGGETLYVTGTSERYDAEESPAVFARALDVASGALRWSVMQNGYYYGEQNAALSKSGDRLYLLSTGPSSRWQIGAISTADASTPWTARLDAYGSAVDIGVLSDGSVIAAGSSEDVTTAVFSPQDGSLRWRHDYDGGLFALDGAAALAVTPDATRAAVVGRSWGWATNSFDSIALSFVSNCPSGPPPVGPVSRPLDTAGPPTNSKTHDIGCALISPAGL